MGSMTLPDGFVVDDVPEGVSEAEVIALLKQQGYQPGPKLEGVTPRRVARSGLQGLTFGFGDEAAGALGAAAATTIGGEPFSKFGDVYADIRDAERGEQTRFQEEEPGAALTSEIAGGLLTGGAGATRAAGSNIARQVASKVPTALRPAGAGMGAGAVYGAGTGEGDLGEQAGSALTGAGLGAVGGVVAQILAKGGAAALTKIRDKLLSVPRRHADRILREHLEELGYADAPEVQAAIDKLGPEGFLADIDTALGGLARDAHVAGGRGKGIIEDALTARDQGQSARMWTAAEEAAGATGNTYQTLKSLDKVQKATAKPMYNNAYRQPVEFTEVLQEMLEDSWVKAAYRKGRELATHDRNRMVDTPPGVARKPKDLSTKRILDGDADPLTTEEWDWIQRGLRARSDTAGRAGAKDTARVAGNLRRELNKEVDTANPAFGEARQTYAGFERTREAIDMGETAFSKKVSVEELRDIVGEFSLAEQQGFMVGVSKYFRDQLLGPGASRDVTRIPLLQSPLVKEKLELVLGKGGAEKFLAKAEAEYAKRRTKNMVMSRSTTADALRGQAEAGGDTILGAAADLAMGSPRTAIRGMANRAKAAPQMSREVAEELAGPLMSNQPRLSPALNPQGPLGQTGFARTMGRLAGSPLMQGAGAVATGGPLAQSMQGPKRNY